MSLIIVPDDWKLGLVCKLVKTGIGKIRGGAISPGFSMHFNEIFECVICTLSLLGCVSFKVVSYGN